MGMLYAARTGKLTLPGALAGGIIGAILYWGTGWTGFIQMAVFFILGSSATEWKRSVKANLLPPENKARTTAQVVANAGVPGALALLALVFPQWAPLLTLMLTASFSSASADTISSELGTLYGKKFINVLSWKPDQRGENGVISLEGALFGLIGSAINATVYAGFEGWSWYLLWIILAGTMGNLADSILGAALERRGVVSNNAVNFLNTLIAALAVLFFSRL